MNRTDASQPAITNATLNSAQAATGARSVVDRRRHRRVRLDVPVLLDTGASHLCGRTVDVSPDGLLVSVASGLRLQSHMDGYFELPTGIAVEGQALVLRSSSDEVALRFTKLSSEASLGLRGFCRLSGIVARVQRP